MRKLKKEIHATQSQIEAKIVHIIKLIINLIMLLDKYLLETNYKEFIAKNIMQKYY